MAKNIPTATIATLLLFGSSTSFGGLTFTTVTSTGGETSSSAQTWIDGTLTKVLITEGADNPFMPPGSYILTNAEGTFLVNPEARTFARFDTSMFTGALNESGAMNMFEFKDIAFEKTVDEEGESIEGYATRHYQFKSSWKMVMAGSPMTTEISSVEDIWATTEISLPAEINTSVNQSSLPASVQELADAQGLRNIEGFALRTVTAQTTKMNMGMGGLGAAMAQRMMNRTGGGGDGTETTTIEVTDIEELDIPADTFAIPADFTETQLFQTGPDVPNLNDLPGAPAPPPDVPNLDDVPRN